MTCKTVARSVILLLGFLLWASGSLFAINPLSRGTDGIAPGFSLSALSGKEVSLSDFKGRPVILFIWTTWCPFCRKELDDLQERYKDIRAAGIELLAVDTGEAKEKVEKYLGAKNIGFPVLLDSASEVAFSYNVIGVPTIILIDSSGLIRFQGNELPENYIQILIAKNNANP